jgi:Protein of unknown function (DUF3667)
MNCKNCGAEIAGEYEFCPHCGEMAHAHRLNLKHIIHEFIHAFVHADKGIFLLVKELAYHPGKAALAYTEGIRKKYFNPVSFLLIAGGLTFFLRLKLSLITKSMGGKKMAFYITEFIHQYTTPIIILTVPVLSLYSWMFFKSSGKNYAENIVMNMYMMGEYHLFTIIIFVLPTFFFPALFPVFTAVSFLTMAVYYYFTCKNFFAQTTTNTIVKVILIEMLFLLSFTIIMVMAMIAYFIVSGLHVRDLK